MRSKESRAPLECQFVKRELINREAISLAVFPFLVVIEMLLNFSNCCTKTQSCSLSLVVSIATRVAVSRSIAKTGVNISHILLRLNDRENAEK